MFRDPYQARTSVIRYAALLVVVAGLTLPLHAQTADCTYDRCALRVRHTFGSDHIVKGADAYPVSTIGMLGPRIEPLETATGDSTRRFYESFRTKQSTGGVLLLIGLATGVASIVVLAQDYEVDGQASGTGIALLSATLVIDIAGGIFVRSGRENLSRSIWHYNRALSR